MWREREREREGSYEIVVYFSSLSAKLEHLTDLQRHLEQSLHGTPDHSPYREGGGATSHTPAGSTNTSFNTYYFTEGGKTAKNTHDAYAILVHCVLNTLELKQLVCTCNSIMVKVAKIASLHETMLE